MGNWFLLLEREETELYCTALRKHGYREEDFDLSERSDPLPCAWIMAISGEAVIKCIKTGITKYYRAGEGSTWPAEFYNDLKDGVFDSLKGSRFRKSLCVWRNNLQKRFQLKKI